MFKKVCEFFSDETKRDILFLVLSAVSLVFSFFDLKIYVIDVAWIAIVLCGIPIIIDAVKGLIASFDIKADVLVSIALIASVIIGEIFAAGEIAFIMQLGALLEELTVAKARAGIEKLALLTPTTARRITNGAEEIVPAEKVEIGDALRVLPGETVPVDGTIVSGRTSIDQAAVTGESLPVDKGVGDEVSSGTINRFGAFEMKATRVGEDSCIQRMIRLVQSADAGKAKIVGLADRWATWIVVIALSAAAITWIVTGEIIRAVTILVVFCPCALVLATPTAVMAAIGNAAKHGFLVKEGDALERLAYISHIAFDKTGTLTYGKPEVAAVVSASDKYTEKLLYETAARAELLSEHPLGKAVADGYKKKYGAAPKRPDAFEALPGLGISSKIDGRHILAGNLKLLKQNNISVGRSIEGAAAEYVNEGCALIYLASDGEAVGLIALSDTLRENAPETVARIKRGGITPVLMTGDNENSAGHIAKAVGIDELYANCMPEDKLKIIDDYADKGEKFCMIGDGINDAPALKKAFAGIAMGGVGSDIAVDAADIALINDDIKEIPHLLRLSKRMMTTIKLNLTFSMALNFAAIVLAITGVLNPVVGALVHNAGSVLVILNSATLLKTKTK